MADTTNPRAELDAALDTMRRADDPYAPATYVTMLATVACAEALALLVDAHLQAADPDPEPEQEPAPDPREGLPDNMPVGHGWVVGFPGNDLFKPEGRRLFTVWIERRRTWGDQGNWHESAIGNPRPATVGDLRRVGLPVSEWPEITAPEPEPDPRKSLPDDTPVAHGWITSWEVPALFKPYGKGRFTRWMGRDREWGGPGVWRESQFSDVRPATVGDLRRVGVPVSEWPDITAPTPEPEPVELPEGSVVLVNGTAWQRTLDCWYAAGQRMVLNWSDLLAQGTPTVLYTSEEVS